jgi:hypothetical protein
LARVAFVLEAHTATLARFVVEEAQDGLNPGAGWQLGIGQT